MMATHTPLGQLHKRVRKKLGERIDWLRIYVVNEEELLLGGTCTNPATRQRVAAAVRCAAPGVRVRNAMIVGERSPGLRVAAVPAGAHSSVPPRSGKGRV
jgi:hypothetical protein